ncbi:hypothetical protein P8452_20981 [Trifolium repens]|nr:hypothetical protein P8452_20981 [Trifolium repens]
MIDLKAQNIHVVLQICLRWLYEQGLTFVVKSYDKERMNNNSHAWDKSMWFVESSSRRVEVCSTEPYSWLFVFYSKFNRSLEASITVSTGMDHTIWLYSKTRKQDSDDCGYYVMKNMLDIVTAKITDSWEEVFNDPTELTTSELFIWLGWFYEDRGFC